MPNIVNVNLAISQISTASPRISKCKMTVS